MRRYISIGLLLLTSVLSGCSTLNATRIPSADISHIKTFYVQAQVDDREVAQAISNQLSLLGFSSVVGIQNSSVPTAVDATVTYQAEWKWDITMYLHELHIQIWDAKTNRELAFGMSRKSSLSRKAPDAVANELLAKIFDK